MRIHEWLVFVGILLSILLLAFIAFQLDWQSFFQALRTIDITRLLSGGCLVLLSILLRAIRWNMLANYPLKQIVPFWQATCIGYLGNLIYPARAGEVLRIIAINQFIKVNAGRSITSSVIDRLMDIIILGVVAWGMMLIHSSEYFGEKFTYIVSSMGVIGLTSLFLLVAFNQYWERLLQQFHPLESNRLGHFAKAFAVNILETARDFSNTRHILIIAVLSLFSFFLDAWAMLEVMRAFAWDLPFEAAITTALFIALGSTLPSAPGYVGIYQIACILALAIYGIDQDNAVAYSIVLQLMVFVFIGTQGLVVTLSKGFDFARNKWSDGLTETNQ